MSSGGTSSDEYANPPGSSGSSEPSEPSASSDSSLARSSAIMAAGTVVSRIMGLVKALMLAAAVGLAVTSDAFDVANSLPNQFYLLLAGGVLNAVLVPQITKAATHDDGGHVFVNRLLTLSLALMLGTTVLATLAAPLLVRAYGTPSWSPETMSLSIAFAFICLPQIFFYGLYTLLGQVLNARSQFAAYMWAPAASNLVAIVGLGYFLLRFPSAAEVGDWTGEMVWVLAGTATLGVAAQALVLVIPLYRGGFRYRPVWGFRGVGLRSASRVAMWTFAAVGVSQLGFVLTSQVLTRANNLLAEAGEVGAGKYAYSLAFLFFMLPHSLVTVSLVTALFTRLSRSAHASDTAGVVADLGRGLRMPAVLLVPASIGGVILAWPALNTLLVRVNDNNPEEVRALSHVLVAMLVGLVPFGWLYLVQRVYYAYEDARTPFYLQLVVTGIVTAFNLAAFVFDPKQAGVLVGAGQTVSNLVAALVGFWLLRRALGRLRLATAVRTYVRLAIASAIAGAILWAALRLLQPVSDSGVIGSVLVLVGCLALFLLLVLAIAHRLRVREVSELLEPVLRRARRGSGAGSTP